MYTAHITQRYNNEHYTTVIAMTQFNTSSTTMTQNRRYRRMVFGFCCIEFWAIGLLITYYVFF